MNLRKYQRGYLGAQNDTLDYRAANRCARTEVDRQPFQALFSPEEDALVINSGDPVGYMSAVGLTDSLAAVVYSSGGAETDIRLALVSRSGTDLTVLQDTSISTVGSASLQVVAQRLTDSKGIVIFTSSTGAAYGMVFDVAGGTSFTTGSQYEVWATSINILPRIAVLSSVKVAAIGSIHGTYIIEISGTVLTVGTVAFFGSRSRYDMVALSSTKLLYTYEASPSLRGRIATVSGTTISYGGEQTLTTYGTTTGPAPTKIFELTGSTAMVAWPTNSGVRICSLSVDGSNVITLGTPTDTGDSSLASIGCFDGVLMSQTKLIVLTKDATSDYPTAWSYLTLGGEFANKNANTVLEEVEVRGMTIAKLDDSYAVVGVRDETTSTLSLRTLSM